MSGLSQYYQSALGSFESENDHNSMDKVNAQVKPANRILRLQSDSKANRAQPIDSKRSELIL